MEYIDIDNYDINNTDFTIWKNVNTSAYSLVFDILYHLLIEDQTLRSHYLDILLNPETTNQKILKILHDIALPYCKSKSNSIDQSTSKKLIGNAIKDRINNLWKLETNIKNIKYTSTLRNLTDISHELSSILKSLKIFDTEINKNKNIISELLITKELSEKNNIEYSKEIDKKLEWYTSFDFINSEFNKLKIILQKLQLLTPFIEEITNINNTLMDIGQFVNIDNLILTSNTEYEQYTKYKIDKRSHDPLVLQGSKSNILNKMLSNMPDLLDF